MGGGCGFSQGKPLEQACVRENVDGGEIYKKIEGKERHQGVSRRGRKNSLKKQTKKKEKKRNIHRFLGEIRERKKNRGGGGGWFPKKASGRNERKGLSKGRRVKHFKKDRRWRSQSGDKFPGSGGRGKSYRRGHEFRRCLKKKLGPFRRGGEKWRRKGPSRQKRRGLNPDN